MNYKELFNICIKKRLFNRIEYIIALFTIPYIQNDEYKSKILRIKDKQVFVKIDNEEILLDYYKFPILDYMDDVILQKDDWTCLDNDLETSIGISLCNKFIIDYPFNGKIKFIDGVISSSVEDDIAERLVSNNYIPKNEEDNKHKIRVSELIDFIDNSEYLKTWNRYFVQAASVKTMLPPEDIVIKKRAIVEEMIKKLGPNAFKDQVNIVELERRLKEIDADYLKDDPTMGIVTSGKVLTNSRKELFLTMGGIPSFDEDGDLTFVLNSLLEGWPLEPDALTAMFNALRAGSLARALDTQYGGLFAKIILRAIGSYVVVTGVDCGTKLGKYVNVNEDDYKRILYRYIYKDGESILIENKDMAKSYIGKTVLMRSPETCNLSGERLCQYCVNKLLSENPDGIKNEVTEVTSGVLNESMKMMHNTTKDVYTLKKSELFS